jgi:hypothetical protein
MLYVILNWRSEVSLQMWKCFSSHIVIQLLIRMVEYQLCERWFTKDWYLDFSYTHELKIKNKELLFTITVTCFSPALQKTIKTCSRGWTIVFRHVKNFRLKSKRSLCILCVIYIKYTQNDRFMVEIFSSIPTIYLLNYFINFSHTFLCKVYTKICWTVIGSFQSALQGAHTKYLKISSSSSIYIYVYFCLWMVFQTSGIVYRYSVQFNLSFIKNTSILSSSLISCLFILPNQACGSIHPLPHTPSWSSA